MSIAPNLNFPIHFPPCFLSPSLPRLNFLWPFSVTYHWATRASIHSSCCSAACPSSSEWPVLYPGSCWVSPSTAPYLRRQNASFSCYTVSSCDHNCVGLQWEKGSDSAGSAACKVELDLWTLRKQMGNAAARAVCRYLMDILCFAWRCKSAGLSTQTQTHAEMEKQWLTLHWSIDSRPKTDVSFWWWNDLHDNWMRSETLKDMSCPVL